MLGADCAAAGRQTALGGLIVMANPLDFRSRAGPVAAGRAAAF